MGHSIRKYRTTDKPYVMELFHSNTPEYFHPSEKEELEDYLENEIEDYFVVELDQEIVGAGGLNYHPDEKTAVISWDFISPAHQGKGIGRALTQHRIKYAHENGAKVIKVRTSQHTYKFYTKNGFDLLRTEKDYWGPGFDLYEMSLKEI